MISKNNFSETLFSYKIQNFASNTSVQPQTPRGNLLQRQNAPSVFFSNKSKIRNIRQLFDFLYKQVTIENRPFFLRRQKFQAKFNSCCINARAEAQTKNVECFTRIKTAHIVIIFNSGGIFIVTLVLYYHKNKEFCVFKSTNRETTILRFESYFCAWRRITFMF